MRKQRGAVRRDVPLSLKLARKERLRIGNPVRSVDEVSSLHNCQKLRVLQLMEILDLISDNV